MMAAVAPSPRGQEECPRVRTMASQRDKSADLFALTARPTPSLFNSREPAGSAPWRNPSIAQVRANAADGRAMRAAEKLLRRSTKCQGTTSRAAEKLLRRSTKCQGTTGAPTQCVGRVPQAPQNESGFSRRGIGFSALTTFSAASIATRQGGQKWLLQLRSRSGEPSHSTFHKFQVEPTEQPNAGESSGQAA